jgi:hypothetical protein
MGLIKRKSIILNNFTYYFRLAVDDAPIREHKITNHAEGNWT